MDEDKSAPEDPEDVVFVHLSGPGFSVRLTSRHWRLIMQYTGNAWSAVVYALGGAVILYALAEFWRETQ